MTQLNGPGPNEADAFRAYLGRLGTERIPPERRLALYRRFQSEQANAHAPSAAERFAREMDVKTGTRNESAWPAQDRDRLRLLREAEATKPSAPAQPLTPDQRNRADALAARNKLIATAADLVRTRDADKSGNVKIATARERELERVTSRITELETMLGL